MNNPTPNPSRMVEEVRLKAHRCVAGMLVPGDVSECEYCNSGQTGESLAMEISKYAAHHDVWDLEAGDAFRAKVAALIRARDEQVRKEEMERCAGVCKTYADGFRSQYPFTGTSLYGRMMAGDELASAIRKGETP